MDHRDHSKLEDASLWPNVQEEHIGQNISIEDHDIGGYKPNSAHLFEISESLSLGDLKKARGGESDQQEDMKQKATHTWSSARTQMSQTEDNGGESRFATFVWGRYTRGLPLEVNYQGYIYH